MMRRCAVALPVLVVLAEVCVRPAFAADPSCAAVTIEATASVATRWPGLLDEVREAFGARDDIDRCARVALTAHDTSVTVDVVLADGRSAVRPVSRREDVLPTLEALLLVPRRSAEAQSPAPLDAAPLASLPASSSSTPSELPRPGPAVLLSVPADRDDPAASPERRARRLRIELSAIAGARIGDGQSGVGLGALSFLDLSGWLVGFEGRADVYKPLSDAPTGGGALELAVPGGRRIPFGELAIDVFAGPALALIGTSSTSTISTPPATRTSQVSGGPVPRILLGVHLDFAARFMVRPFVGLDAELGPAGPIGAPLPDGVPGLPIWTLGLALGATVGTQ
jgi:hypothetical protein